MRWVQILSIAFVIILLGGQAVFSTTYTVPATTEPTTAWSPEDFEMTSLEGTLVEVEGTTLRIHTVRRVNDEIVIQDYLVPIDVESQIMVDADPATVQDLKPGMTVVCRYQPTVGDVQETVFITATSRGLNGNIVKIDGNNLVVRVGHAVGIRELTVTTDAHTRVFVPDPQPDGVIRIVEGTLSDLKAGMRIKIIPETGTAKKIFVGPAHGPAPATRPGK